MNILFLMKVYDVGGIEVVAATLAGAFEHHVVGGSHGVGTDTREIVDALIYIVVNDTLGTRHTLALHREQC